MISPGARRKAGELKIKVEVIGDAYIRSIGCRLASSSLAQTPFALDHFILALAMDAPPFDTSPSAHTHGFEDFFNFDMLAGSSSRSSSRSPAHSPAFPPTPPQVNADGDVGLFTLGLFDDFAKEVDPLAPSIQAPAGPYDFLNALANYAATTSPAASSSATAVSPPLAIDPQLVDSPSPERDDMSDDEDNDEDDADEAPSPVDVPKVGGKGKQRKGTVQGGGVTKKVRVAEKKEKKEDTPDDWRPSPEEYKKMSSKEKRQLRNKISARNFRNRRKGDYDDMSGVVQVTNIRHRIHYHARG
jgi:hypothetical protein